MNDSVLARFLAKVEPGSETGCWMWTACIAGGGYGYLTVETGKPRVAHKLAYEHWIGPVPDGLTLDHLCHSNDPECPGGGDCLHRRCVNPDHLEPVTRGENVLRGVGFAAVNARKTHCPEGHPYDEANTYVNPVSGYRICRACGRERNIQRYRDDRDAICAERRRRYAERVAA